MKNVMGSGMDLVLCPSEVDDNKLRTLYVTALQDAREIYIASAYLTDWPADLVIGRNCDRIVFLVGTDFGLTRKKAMRDVLRWLPKTGYSEFLAVPKLDGAGFHPKIMAWQSIRNKYYVLVGSSNLTKAAFDRNYEANAFGVVSSSMYDAIKKWLSTLQENAVPVTEDWIENHYQESKQKRGNAATGKKDLPLVNFKLPSGIDYKKAVKERRKQIEAFREIEKSLNRAVRQCANREIEDGEFWSKFWKTWSNHESRFQGSGLQFKGKGAKWHQACASLLAIREANKKCGSAHEVDRVVAREIDRLARLKNPARGAWLSEMLCHYLPDSYPIRNAPVKDWLAWNKWRARRGSSEGARYVQIAKQLRHVLKANNIGAKNLAELDQVIWLWSDKRKRRKNQIEPR